MVIKTKEEFIGAVRELVNQGMVSDLAEMGEPLTAMDVAECGVDTVFSQNQVQGIEPTDKLLKEIAKIMKYYV
jgi:hypothetical protein